MSKRNINPKVNNTKHKNQSRLANHHFLSRKPALSIIKPAISIKQSPIDYKMPNAVLKSLNKQLIAYTPNKRLKICYQLNMNDINSQFISPNNNLDDNMNKYKTGQQKRRRRYIKRSSIQPGGKYVANVGPQTSESEQTLLKNQYEKKDKIKSDSNIKVGHKNRNTSRLKLKVKNPFQKIMELEKNFDRQSDIGRPLKDSLMTSGDQQQFRELLNYLDF